ncbi:MAG: response regulator [Myxococcota bacterium]|nr:response regulator [Myxococcota bacterium]
MASSPIRVLLVDDDEDDYVITRDLLAQVTTPKCALEWRSTYDTGLAAAMENRHDVYLFDYALGARDGIELVRAAAERNVTGPVLLLTAHDEADLDVLAAAAGATDYLVKGHMTAPLLGRAIRYALARHESNDALRRGAHEKTVMLQEIHHRVKNNLQVISSLFNFQMEHLENPETRAILRVTQMRVHSIALIHEKLYQSPLLASVDMGDYMSGLVAMLTQTHDRHVLTEIRAGDIVLPVDIGLHCGLIVSELVTNALKHAFPVTLLSQSLPTIVVDLRRRENDFVLCVTDNGVGWSGPLDTESTKSLGLRLIGMFAQQLGGGVVFSSDGGTCCKVTFPTGNA